MKHNILVTFLVILGLIAIGLVAYIALNPDKAVAPIATEQKKVSQKKQSSTPEQKIAGQSMQKNDTSAEDVGSKEHDMKENITVPTDWKKYTSKKYGFSFSFPGQWVLNTDESTDDNIVISDFDNRPEFKGFGKWQYNVTIKPNTKNLTLQNITEIDLDLKELIAESSKSGKEIISDVMVGGENGKYYKVCESDDSCRPTLIYVIHSGNVIIIISESSDMDLLTLASSFVFEK